MNLSKKRVLVLGLAISGVSTAKALDKLGAQVVVSDSKKPEELNTFLEELKDIDVEYFLNTNSFSLEGIDLIVKSPGIPLDIPILFEANKQGIETITDIELAYRISRNPFIAITGTNGKTTTTTLAGELFKNARYKYHVTGNIGVGILWEIVNCDDDDIFVIEASSFQLESTREFKPKISVITNITPDHLNWHKSFENYINAKKKVFVNQDSTDYTILNYDDLLLRNMKEEVKGKLIYFSTNSELDYGVYIKGEDIVVNDGESIRAIIPYKSMKIPGKHNLQHALAVVAIGWTMGVDFIDIGHTLKNFEGVEHRVEYVDIIDGMTFYNDSKGTNPDASIKAVEALEKPIILIAGGMDKGSDFEDFIKSFNNKVKSLILLGETAEKIKNTAISLGFNNIYIVENMREAVYKGYEIGSDGDNILLSPACASWDMYSNYEERGRDFKSAVMSLRRA